VTDEGLLTILRAKDSCSSGGGGGERIEKDRVKNRLSVGEEERRSGLGRTDQGDL